MKKGKELTIKQMLKKQGQKIIVAYPHREDLIMIVRDNKLVDEKGEYYVEEGTDCKFYECIEEV